MGERESDSNDLLSFFLFFSFVIFICSLISLPSGLMPVSDSSLKFDVASPLAACDMEAVHAFSAIRSPQNNQKHARVNLAFF